MQKCLLFLLTCLIASPAFGRAVDNNDLHFLFGYQAFLKKEFSLCISEFDQAMKTETRKRMMSKMHLFQSICRAKLDERKKAAYDAVRIETKYLNSWDQTHFVRLKNYLSHDYDVAMKEKNAPKKPQWPLYFSVTPYLGQTSYSETSQKKKAGFEGFLASASYHNWEFIVGYEKYTLAKRQDFYGYTQAQGHLAIERTIGKWKLAGRYTSISSKVEPQDDTQIYGLGAAYQLFSRTIFSVDGYYSQYDKSTEGKLSVFQPVYAIEQGLLKTDIFNFWLKAGLQQTTPDSGSIRRGESTTVAKGIASRTFLDLNMRFRHIILGASFWAGSEYYGVRNNGTLIFNTAEEHLGGQQASFRWEYSKRWHFDAVWMNENIRINRIDSTSQTAIGKATYNFY